MVIILKKGWGSFWNNQESFVLVKVMEVNQILVFIFLLVNGELEISSIEKYFENIVEN